MGKINIQVSRDTHSLLKELGSKGESYEDILLKYLPVRASYGTKDSYSTSYPLRSIDEISFNNKLNEYFYILIMKRFKEIEKLKEVFEKNNIYK